VTVEPSDAGFEVLLEFIRQTRGFDFTNYKRSTLSRRVNKRMADVSIESFEDYMEYLELHSDEFAQLFDTVLINVSRFFRDKEAWDFVTSEIVPRIVEKAGDSDPIRVWSAGCASGEEAYTLSMVFCEALGAERFRRQVKIYATDADEGALAQARQGAYAAGAVSDVPEELTERYFEHTANQYVFRNELRRSVIFGRHDLTSDAPISRLDLLVCRNTLMYFNAEAQDNVLRRLHFALNPDGYLFLGRAELLLTHARLFAPLNLKARVFTKALQPDAVPRGQPAAPPAPQTDRALRDMAFDASPVAQLIVGVDGTMVAANDQARAMFGINARDIGRPLQDLEVSYRPLELRSRIEQAYTERRTVHARNVERIFPDAQVQHLDVAVIPVPLSADSALLGACINFADVTRNSELQAELKRSSEDLETAYEELQSANEELETSNEELQATVEELETTNEELQSANEELETINEELQATNEELETMNEELRTRTAELDVTNSFLESILATEPHSVVVLDGQGMIRLWNHAAEQLWGLRAEEVRGSYFFNLDFGLLPAPELEQAVRATSGGQDIGEFVLDGMDRKGRKARFRISSTSLAGQSPGTVIVMQEIDHPGETRRE
jgi:two-component system CheB/CheR fusion protein